MKLRSAELVIVGVAIAFVLIPFFVTPTHAADPSLTQILENIGFTNIAQSPAQTFPTGTYNITLLAEFAGWHESNELSYYELNYPNVFNVIFTGAEGNEGYTDPPISKLFTTDYQFGFSLLVPGPHRYFTENHRNEWSIQHAKVYENLDEPGMYLIGFENQYGWWGDRDFNDMVFSIKPYAPTVEHYLTVETDPAYITTILGEGWYDNCTYVDLTAPDLVPASGFRYRFNYWDIDGTPQGSNPITVHMDANHTATAHYVAQYYLTIGTNFGAVSPSDGWYDAGSIISISATSPSTISGERYVWNGWTGTGTGSYTGLDNPASVTMNAPVAETASWTHQYYLSVNSPHGTPGGEGWYDSGDTAYATVTPLTVSGPTGVQYVFTNWGDDASGTTSPSNPITMDCPKTATANWKTQYYLTLTTTSGGTTDPASSAWYDSGSLIQVMAIPDIDYSFDHWELDAVPVGSANPCNILMDDVHDLHAVFLYSPTPPPNYYLTVLSPYDIPGGEGWYVNGSTAYASLTTDIIDHGNGTRRVFTHWSGDASGTNYAQSDPITMTANKTAVANWKTQYYLTLTTDPSSVTIPSGEGWYDAGTYASISTITLVDIVPGSSRYNFSGWTTADMPEITDPASPSTTVLMDKPKTVIANYKTQYLITFDQSGVGVDFTGNVVSIDGSNYGVGGLSISFWWDSGTDHSFSFASPLVVDVSKQYVWTSTSGLSTSQSDTLTVTNSGSVTGHYSIGTKYQITFDQVGVGSDFTDAIVIIDGTPYSRSSLPVSFWWDVGTMHSFSFLSPLVVTSDAKQYVWESTTGLSTLQTDSITVTMSGSVTGNYKTQFYLTVTSPYDSPTPTSGWFDDGTSIVASITSPVSGSPNTQYVCTGWTGTGSVPESGITTSATFTINEPSIITWNWKTQYYLTVTSPYGTPGGEGWYDGGSTAYATLYTGAVDQGNGTRRIFTSWTGDASGTDHAQSNPITMDGPKTATASWKTQYYLTLTTTSGGITNPSSSGWHDVGTIVSVTAIPDTYYLFDHWELDSINIGSANPYDVTVDTAHTLHAVFVHEMSTLTVTATPGGTTNLPPGSYVYPAGTSVVITALPSPNYVFDHWEFDGLDVGSANPYTVFLNPDHTLNAVFLYSPPSPPSSPVVGGSTVSIKSPLLPTWISLNVVLIATIFITASWMKRRKK